MFLMKIIDWKWLVVPIGADVPEHCAHVSALLCSLHPPNWTELLQWDRTRQSRDFEMRRRHVKTSVGKTTELPELQSSSEACWNLWCLFCLVRRFFLSWMFHSVKGVYGLLLGENVDKAPFEEESFLLWFYVHTVMVQKERFRRKLVKPLANAWQGNSIDYFSKTTCILHVYIEILTLFLQLNKYRL